MFPFSHFHSFRLDTPGVSGLIEGVLHHPGDGLPLREDLGQVPGAQYVPQGGCGQQPGGVRVVLNVAYCHGRVADSVVDYRINTNSHRVPGQNLYKNTNKDTYRHIRFKSK